MIIFITGKYGLENIAWMWEPNPGFLTPCLSPVAIKSTSRDLLWERRGMSVELWFPLPVMLSEAVPYDSSCREKNVPPTASWFQKESLEVAELCILSAFA